MLQNVGISDITAWISSRYTYCQTGTDGSGSSTTTYTNLVAPVGTRVTCTKSIETTYTTNDTATFVAIITSSGDYTINEAGIFKDLTTSGTDVMLSRQVLTSPITVVTSQNYGIIWKVISARGT